MAPKLLVPRIEADDGKAVAGGGQRIAQHQEQFFADLIDTLEAAHVDDQRGKARELAADPPGDPLGFHERELALQLAHCNGVPVMVECLDLFLPPHPARTHIGAAIEAPHRILPRAAILEEMEAEVARNVLADLHPALRIAHRIEPRREDADAQMPRQHRRNAAADAALGRQPDIELPATRIVIHAAGAHHAEHRAHIGRRNGALARHRVDPAIGQRCAHDGEIDRVH
jgi:hypothetical protein